MGAETVGNLNVDADDALVPGGAEEEEPKQKKTPAIERRFHAC